MKKQWILSVTAAAALSCCLTGCEKKPELVKDYEIEAGSELSEDVSTYATFGECVDAGSYKVDLEGVDTARISTYDAKLVNTENNKEYAFQITVVDTVYPEAELKEDYTITQPGTCHASDYVENIEDATKTKVGFLSFEKREDLHQMSDDEVKEDAKSGYEEQSFTEEMIFEEEKEITEEGIYDVKLAVKDEAGNMKVFDYSFYIDGTGPMLPEHEDETIQINDADGAFMLEFDDYHCSDNFDDDWQVVDETTVDYESQNYYINDEGKSVEDVKVIIHSTDRAGNESEQTWIVTAVNSYDYEAELQKLISQMRDSSASGSGSGSANSENAASESTSTAASEAAAQSTAQSGFDRAKAEEEFALVNQQRSENGVATLTWDEGMYELACVRAQECVQNFSHTRPDGTLVSDTYLYGENLAMNYKSTTNLINGWMNSPGHRGNILNSDYTKGVMACYLCDGVYYWVNLFAW